MATDLEEFQGQHLQVNNELAIPATSVYSMAYTSESPTPQSISYTPKHAASSLASESGDTLTQKILSVPRNRKSSEDLKKYNKEKKRVWRNKEDVTIKERIRNRLSKRLQRSQELKRKRDNVRIRNTASHRVLREDPVYRENEQARNTAAHRVLREDPVYRENEQARNTAAHRVLRKDPVYRENEQARNTATIEHQLNRQDSDYVEREKETFNFRKNTHLRDWMAVR